MNKWKRILALAGVVLLVLVAMLPLVFAMGDGEAAQSLFRGSVAAAFAVPILLYVILLVYQYYRKKGGEQMGKKSGDIDTIIFDVGNVLVDYDWESYLDSFHFPPEEREVLAEVVFKSRIWDEKDRGVGEEAAMGSFIQAAPQYEDDIRKVVAESYRTIRPRDYAETWVKYLKSKGYKLYILSNYSEEGLEKTRHMIPEKYMDGVIFSCYVKQIKPEPEIYRTLLDTYGIVPEKAVFLDDRKENLEAAEKFGIRTILFRDFKQAAAELEKLGVQ